MLGIIGFVILGMLLILIIENEYDPRIQFSKETGFYEDAFELRIIGGAGNDIYYTLDGSEPTTESYLYDESQPICMEDATNHENVYSKRIDTSTGFFKELITQYSTEAEPGYTVPDYNVDKCNIVRAAVFNEEGEVLDSEEAIYFVGFEDKKGYNKTDIVSIVTDPKNLFDYDTGIYTTGKAFDEYINNSYEEDGWKKNYWWWWQANYRNAGAEWEREATITIFNKDHAEILSEDCGIRIQGGGSRGFLPKNIGCYARQEYSGNNKFSIDLFDSGKNPHKFILFSGSDDSQFKIKDYLANSLARELNLSTMKFRPCVLFLNGEYWGSYYMIENYNNSYIVDHYDVSEENIVMFKNDEIKEGTIEDEELYYEMLYFIAPNDMTIPEYYDMACEMIDIDSFIDYYAAQIYIAREGDWPESNYALWRTRDKEKSVYGDCKWRWMLFDVNSGGLDFENLNSDTLSRTLERDDLFNALYKNEEFREKFVRRLLEIGQNTYSIEKCNELIDSYVDTMKDPILASNRRFYNNEFENEFEENVKQMRLFFEKRYDVVWQFLVDNVGEEWLEQNGIVK